MKSGAARKGNGILMEPNEIMFVGGGGISSPRGVFCAWGGPCCTAFDIDFHGAVGGPRTLVVGNGASGDAGDELDGELDVQSLRPRRTCGRPQGEERAEDTCSRRQGHPDS